MRRSRRIASFSGDVVAVADVVVVAKVQQWHNSFLDGSRPVVLFSGCLWRRISV